MKKNPRSLSGYGGRSEEAVPQLGGPHPSSIRSPGREMTRPNTTIDATTLPEAPGRGLERNGAADVLRPTMLRGNVKGIVRRVKHYVSVRHQDGARMRQKR